MKYSKYSVAIIGSGISGLFLANKLAQHSEFNDGILIITKEKLFSGSSSLAQGGIVSVIPELNIKDSIESHIKDTIDAGCGLNNISAVQYVSKQSSKVTQDLINFGVKFDENSNQKLNFTLEGAHSCPRILHANGDSTGRIIEEALCKRLDKASNIDLYENTMAIELLVDDDNSAKGLIAYNWMNDNYEVIYTSNIVIATGGIGQIYKNTTNPIESTADGIALAYRAGAELSDMEFVQFHPTALYVKNKKTSPLVSESVRGEGAKLVNINGEYFAKNYHYLADLAPRDVVARAIRQEMINTNSNYVNLDISQIGIEKFKHRFPTITKLCLDNDIDLESGLIPVVPSEHYFMGGIKTDLSSKTSINNVYAIGECASTGLHGANRLASNSLLECVVFADSLAQELIHNNMAPPKKHGAKLMDSINKYINFDDDMQDENEKIQKLFDELKTTMSQNVGIARNKSNLELAISKIDEITFDLSKLQASNSRLKFELQNALCVSKLIAQSALKRETSIGAHYRDDEAKKDVQRHERKGKYDTILVK